MSFTTIKVRNKIKTFKTDTEFSCEMYTEFINVYKQLTTVRVKGMNLAEGL